jgi:hypothetical protein
MFFQKSKLGTEYKGILCVAFIVFLQTMLKIVLKKSKSAHQKKKLDMGWNCGSSGRALA